ncbi:MAG: phenylacetic acid degradation NADH oxidoreductase PaaE [Bacteroidia bacterium]|nr:MAG: phenylacetic acid degradation NADH oxidoreductase PaaE [Bacteroidia bacterium]
MSHFYPLKIKNIEKVSKDAVALTFDIPLQYIPQFRFKQGQFITLKININGESVIRSYSICTSPYSEKELKVAVKEVPGGKMSTYINRTLKIGDTVDVMPPSGKFYTELNSGHQKHYVLFAGGSGITPMMSIIKSILFIEKQSTIVLFYANREPDNVIFKNEIDTLSKNHPQLKVVYIFDNPPTTDYPSEQSGLLNEEKINLLLEKHASLHADEYFICGPAPMMELIENTLKKLHTPAEKIHIEHFTAVATNDSDNTTTEEIESEVTVILYGIETTFKLKSTDINILDAAIQNGVDAPFSCKGGVCSTCRAKIIEGKATMKANYALTDDEVKEGYILTCQAHPASEKLIVDYDAL